MFFKLTLCTVLFCISGLAYCDGNVGRWEGYCQNFYPLKIQAIPQCRLAKWSEEAQVPSVQECVSVSEIRAFWRECQSRWPGVLDRYRVRISDRLTGVDSTGVLRSLLLGEKIVENSSPGIPPAFLILRILGFVHVINATGIHLLVLFSVWVALGRGFCFFVKNPLVARNFRSLFRVCGFGLCAYAWALSGLRPGMLRPALMLSLNGLAGRMGWRWRRGVALILAVGVDACIASFFVPRWAPGRWVYFAAILGAVLGMTSGKKTNHVRLGLSSWILVAYWEAWDEGWIAWSTPGVSWLTVGAVCFGFYPVLLLSTVFGQWDVVDFLSKSFEIFLSFFVRWSMELPSFWLLSKEQVLLGVACAVAIWFSRERWKRAVCVLLIVVWVGVKLSAVFSHGKTQVVQLNVGQGDSAWVSGADHQNGLIDTGSRFALSYEKWLRWFASHGINQLDWVALTHLDEDHAGALEKISILLPIRCVGSSDLQWRTPRGEKWAKMLGSQSIRVAAWSEGCFPFVAIEPGFYSGPNSRMSLLMVPLDQHRLYINSGDADQKQERQWVSVVKNRIRENQVEEVILKAGHHGSKTSSSEEWLAALHPKEVWISVGAKNRYGHPSQEVLERILRHRAPIRRTDLDGELSLLKKQPAAIHD